METMRPAHLEQSGPPQPVRQTHSPKSSLQTPLPLQSPGHTPFAHENLRYKRKYRIFATTRTRSRGRPAIATQNLGRVESARHTPAQVYDNACHQI